MGGETLIYGANVAKIGRYGVRTRGWEGAGLKLFRNVKKHEIFDPRKTRFFDKFHYLTQMAFFVEISKFIVFSNFSVDKRQTIKEPKNTGLLICCLPSTKFLDFRKLAK